MPLYTMKESLMLVKWTRTGFLKKMNKDRIFFNKTGKEIREWE